MAYDQLEINTDLSTPSKLTSMIKKGQGRVLGHKNFKSSVRCRQQFKFTHITHNIMNINGITLCNLILQADWMTAKSQFV